MLEQRGEIELETIPVNRNGMVFPAEVQSRLKSNTLLVSILLASNETGVLQPIAGIASLVKAHGALMHTDAVQALGRLSVDVEKLKVDLLSLSAHKVGGIGGMGALYIREKSLIEPIFVGGGQEFGLRSSTQNVPGAAAFAAACQEISPWSTAVRNEFELRLSNELDGFEVIGKNGPRLPNTSCIRFDGCEADGILMGLDIQGIGVSTGSACSTGSIEPSRILLAMGLSVEEAKSCIRFSFPKELTSEDLERVVSTTSELVDQMRRVRS
jgi:cysteine desulfurase